MVVPEAPPFDPWRLEMGLGEGRRKQPRLFRFTWFLLTHTAPQV